MSIQGKKILVVDDDINLCQSIKIDFTRAGAIVFTATDGQNGLQQFQEHQPDLVILDVRMPVMNGWDTCRNIRMISSTPIIMLTSVSQDHEIVRGLNYGADDFVTKPFSRDVLAARCAAVLRRTDSAQKTSGRNSYCDDYLSIDLEKRQVLVRNQPIKLTSTEYRLLTYLLENANEVLSYQTILTSVWGWEYQNNIDYVHVYLSHLRRKIEADPRNPVYLLNEHGVGYSFHSQTNQHSQPDAMQTELLTASVSGP
jgi:two-component system KDP operon response regulator KdpE